MMVNDIESLGKIIHYFLSCFLYKLNVDLENQIFWGVLCVDWWTNTSSVKECAASIFMV